MYHADKIFQEYKDNSVALYGLGTETERVLEELEPEFHIVGLLDGFQEEGMMYGKPIISLSRVIEKQVKLIIVVARPGSCRAIAKRIGSFCAENQIELWDIRGKNLCEANRITYDFREQKGITKRELSEMLKTTDVVSIDLFDTLIMRKVLLPSDVIELVNYKMEEQGIFIDKFCEKRLQCEKELAKQTAPTLEEIYYYMREKFPYEGITPKQLAHLEWLIDYDLVLPRKEMCELIAGVYKQGKKVYIVSDTFYTKEQLMKMLEKCQMTSFTDILASCEYKTGKTQELFTQLKTVIQNQKCIHIGDDVTADIEGAQKQGILPCRIYSALDLLEMIGYLGLWDYADSFSTRIKMGLFVAGIFNSPFQFETAEKKLAVKDAYEIGYLFFAPIISDFVIWFNSRVEKNNVKNIWFGARDGYLIKSLYDILLPQNSAVYFLTSRMSAIRAGIEDENDIKYVAGMKYSGTLQGQLKERFGIEKEEVELENCSLMDFSTEIIHKAACNRQNYQTYINTLHLQKGDIAFFDFVAKGTSQMYVSRLVDKHIKGLYFLQLEKEYMKEKGLDIQAFYENDEKHASSIYENYYILETVLTSPMPSVLEFDEEGNACYAKETRKKKDIECFQKVQQGIVEYFKVYVEICPNLDEIDKKADEIFLDLIHKITIGDKDFLELKVEDPFFNRMTDMRDLI